MAAGRPPFWISLGHMEHMWTTHGDYFVVPIIVPNLVMIDAVVSIVLTFQYLVHLAGKCLFMPPKLGF